MKIYEGYLNNARKKPELVLKNQVIGLLNKINVNKHQMLKSEIAEKFNLLWKDCMKIYQNSVNSHIEELKDKKLEFMKSWVMGEISRLEKVNYEFLKLKYKSLSDEELEKMVPESNNLSSENFYALCSELKERQKKDLFESAKKINQYPEQGYLKNENFICIEQEIQIYQNSLDGGMVISGQNQRGGESLAIVELKGLQDELREALMQPSQMEILENGLSGSLILN